MPDRVAVADDVIAAAVACLRRGELVGMPTETVYGLAGDAANAEAVRRIFATKGRPADHPLIVHLADAEALDDWAREISTEARALAARFWPGPMTLILKRSGRASDLITGGQDTVGVRVPDHPVATALLKAFGGGLAAPSANRFGHVSPTTAAHVRSEFGEQVAMVLDGGMCRVGIESTIVDVSGVEPRVLRPGGIIPAELAAVLGIMPGMGAKGAVPRVSGSLSAHYAPQTSMVMLSGERLRDYLNMQRHSGRRCSVLAHSRPALADQPHVWRMLPLDPAAYAQALYASLRAADDDGADCIVIEAPPIGAAWDAVHDRLGRALAGAGKFG